MVKDRARPFLFLRMAPAGSAALVRAPTTREPHKEKAPTESWGASGAGPIGAKSGPVSIYNSPVNHRFHKNVEISAAVVPSPAKLFGRVVLSSGQHGPTALEPPDPQITRDSCELALQAKLFHHLYIIKHFALAITLCLLTVPVLAQSLAGRADVIDGDTLAIQGEPTRIRLYGVDAPEGKQTCDDATGRPYLCGSRSADALASLIGRNGRVTCREEDRDRYGRVVAVCLSNGRDINTEMIRQGWAVEYKQYSDGRYSEEEDEAHRAKRGLWAGTFAKPWEWRRGQR